METNQKKFNIIDLIIILAIVAVIASPFLRTFVKNITFSEKNATKSSITLHIPNQDMLILRAINIDDTVYFENTNKKCGTISKISYSNENNDNSTDFYITLSCLTKIEDSGTYINNETFVAKGAQLQLYTSKYTFNAIVVDVNNK